MKVEFMFSTRLGRSLQGHGEVCATLAIKAFGGGFVNHPRRRFAPARTIRRLLQLAEGEDVDVDSIGENLVDEGAGCQEG